MITSSSNCSHTILLLDLILLFDCFTIFLFLISSFPCVFTPSLCGLPRLFSPLLRASSLDGRQTLHIFHSLALFSYAVMSYPVFSSLGLLVFMFSDIYHHQVDFDTSGLSGRSWSERVMILFLSFPLFLFISIFLFFIML